MAGWLAAWMNPELSYTYMPAARMAGFDGKLSAIRDKTFARCCFAYKYTSEVADAVNRQSWHSQCCSACNCVGDGKVARVL